MLLRARPFEWLWGKGEKGPRHGAGRFRASIRTALSRTLKVTGGPGRRGDSRRNSRGPGAGPGRGPPGTTARLRASHSLLSRPLVIPNNLLLLFTLKKELLTY